MIVRIDEDGVVRTSGHAGFAADADRFIEIDDAIRALEHGGGGAGHDARRVRALITTGDLVRAARLRKDTDVDVLHIGPGDADGHDIFRLAGGRARVTANAPRMVDDLRPLDAILANWFLIDH